MKLEERKINVIELTEEESLILDKASDILAEIAYEILGENEYLDLPYDEECERDTIWRGELKDTVWLLAHLSRQDTGMVIAEYND